MQNSLAMLQKSPIRSWNIQETGLYRAPQGQRVPLHQHACWELVYYRSGNALCQVGNHLVTTHPGMLLVMPPGLLHAETTEGNFTNIYFQVEIEGIPDWPTQCFDDDELAIGNTLHALVREWNGQKIYRSDMLRVLFTQLNIQLSRAHTHHQLAPEAKIVADVEQLMELHFSESITIPDLAHKVGVAPSTLRGYFKQHRGITPLAKLQSIRERHALALLHTSTLTLTEIAHLCGYDSASHLSNHLRQQTGMSPGRLRHLKS